MTVAALQQDDYPPISDYGYIADCHSQALISIRGSIDWCCMPRVDSACCFGRLLDRQRGGYCQIAPRGSFECSRQYLESTLVLETTFKTSEGEVRLLDCFTMCEGGQHHPHQQILRVLEGVRGRVEIVLDLEPRFDYGAIKPWIRKSGPGQYQVFGGANGLFISGDFDFEFRDRHRLAGFCVLKKGERVRLSILYRKPAELDEGLVEALGSEELDRRLDETIEWWRRWSSRGDISGPYRRQLQRSAIVLKGLTNAPTGAIAAAATTSLPESPGGSRNWDYRFSWIRDSSFAVSSLGEVGYLKEAGAFRRFIERSAAGSAQELQILFGVEGQRRLHEYEIPEMEGYRRAKPVRVGNAAETQNQMDVYGWLLTLSWRWHLRGHTPDEDYWEFLVELVNAAGNQWKNPGQGIWEMRGEPRHFVHSKAMCWSALDCGIKLAKDLGHNKHLSGWKEAREEVRRAVEEKGYDAKRGVFIQAFGYPVMDSALLLLPFCGFVDFKDERMVRTTEAVRAELERDGLLLRYAAESDGLEGKEGRFLPCSFWLAECLARQGRLEAAHQVYQQALATGNDLGLFSEEYDTERGEMLGNFPQALTHLSLIAAAVALAKGDKAN